MNDTITGSLDSIGEVDVYTFDGRANEEVVLYFRIPMVGLNNPAFINFRTPSDGYVLDLDAVPYFLDLEASSTGRVTLPVDGTYRLYVGRRGVWPTVPYELQVRRIDRRPERAAATLVPGDTLRAEAIDHVGDIDEFVVEGTPGDAYNIFILPNESGSNAVRAELVDVPNSEVYVAPGALAVASGLGAVVVPAGGRIPVRVFGADDREGMFRGGYRMLALRIEPAPESASPGLASGATVSERIDIPGDVDRYSFALTNGGPVNIRVQKPPGDGVAGDFRVRLRRAGESADIALEIDHATTTGDLRLSTGTVQLAPGTYTVEVDPRTGRMGGFLGRYEVTLFVIDTAPEHRSMSIAIGDTISGESIDHLGDIDLFTFAGVAGQSVYAFIAPATPDAPFPEFGYEIVHPRLGPLVTRPEGMSGPLPSQRVQLPETGTYQLRVAAVNTKDYRFVGPYRTGVLEASRLPESVPSQLTLGARVTQERTDYAGDIDEFTLAAAPGQELVATYYSEASLGSFLRFTVLDPATGDTLAKGSEIGSTATEPFRIPTSGRALFRVAEPRECQSPAYCYHARGPFWLQTHPLNRAPETAGARLVVGDTMRLERLDADWDIDEFVFAGVAAESVRLLLSVEPSPEFTGVTRLALIDPLTGSVLATASSTGGQNHSATVALPGTRDFLIRVSSESQITRSTYSIAVLRP